MAMNEFLVFSRWSTDKVWKPKWIMEAVPRNTH